MGLEEFQAFVEDVRSRTSIVDVVGADAKLQPVGRGMRCLSPLRTERTPSFFVYPESDSWFDYGISEGGDVFTYVMRRDGCGFREAVDLLASRANLSYARRTEADGGEYADEINALLERRYVFDLLTEAARFYHRQLPRRMREFVRAHYGFTDETIDAYLIGWAPGGGTCWKYLTDQLGHAEGKVLKTGLFIGSRREPIDFFEDRIVFPYMIGGFCRYMIARRSSETNPFSEHEAGKYKKLLTQSERHPYVSRHVSNEWFYGEDSVRRRVPLLTITEGITDAIAILQAGFPCISPVTTRFRERDVPRMIELTKHADRIVIVNDADPSGLAGAIKTATALFRAGRDVRIGQLTAPGAAA